MWYFYFLLLILFWRTACIVLAATVRIPTRVSGFIDSHLHVRLENISAAGVAFWAFRPRCHSTLADWLWVAGMGERETLGQLSKLSAAAVEITLRPGEWGIVASTCPHTNFQFVHPLQSFFRCGEERCGCWINNTSGRITTQETTTTQSA